MRMDEERTLDINIEAICQWLSDLAARLGDESLFADDRQTDTDMISDIRYGLARYAEMWEDEQQYNREKAQQPEKLDIEYLQVQIDEYFQSTPDHTRSGLCAALGVTYQTLNAYAHGFMGVSDYFKRRDYNKDLEAVMRGAVYKINDSMERRAGSAAITEALKQQGVFSDLPDSTKGPPFDLGKYSKYGR
jgi:hypothetical protein